MDSLVISNIKKEGQKGNTIFTLSDGQTYGYSQVLRMAEAGEIVNVEVRKLEDGSKYLYYDNPDTLQANDLYNVPEDL